MQRYELDAWLGDNHDLTDEQVTELLRTANHIESRYPDPDDANEAATALTTAYRLLVEDTDTVLDELAERLSQARVMQLESLAALRQAAVTLVHDGGRGAESEQGFAQRAGVTRMAVRGWLGKR